MAQMSTKVHPNKNTDTTEVKRDRCVLAASGVFAQISPNNRLKPKEPTDTQ